MNNYQKNLDPTKMIYVTIYIFLVPSIIHINVAEIA